MPMSTLLSLINVVLYNELDKNISNELLCNLLILLLLSLLFLAALPMMESVQENVVALVKEHPAGIPLKKLAQCYHKKYKQNLSLSSLGMDSVISLIASLDSELVIKGQMVIYNDTLHINQVWASPIHYQQKKVAIDNLYLLKQTNLSPQQHVCFNMVEK